MTVNPYLGDDALEPFLERCDQGKGVFVLARTSNPGAAELQEKDCDGRPLYLHVTEMIARLGSGRVGAHGYSDVGAVVGATAPTSLAAVRAALPHAFLLIPGFGAQGAGPGGARRLGSRRGARLCGQRLALDHLRLAGARRRLPQRRRRGGRRDARRDRRLVMDDDTTVEA